MSVRRTCPVCGQELVWVVCEQCEGDGRSFCCGNEGGWWECPGVETEEAHLVLIRRNRRRLHLLELLAGGG